MDLGVRLDMRCNVDTPDLLSLSIAKAVNQLVSRMMMS